LHQPVAVLARKLGEGRAGKRRRRLGFREQAIEKGRHGGARQGVHGFFSDMGKRAFARPEKYD
jgi:hypothetical protein